MEPNKAKKGNSKKDSNKSSKDSKVKQTKTVASQEKDISENVDCAAKTDVSPDDEVKLETCEKTESFDVSDQETSKKCVESNELTLLKVDEEDSNMTSTNTSQKVSEILEKPPLQDSSPPRPAVVEKIAPDSSNAILRDDEDCFLADFTKEGSRPEMQPPKFTLWEPFKRGRIAPALLEMDPEVTLRIRSSPGLDAPEVGIVQSGDNLDLAGRCGSWLRICGNEERWVLECTDDLVLIEILPSSGWGISWGRSLLSSLNQRNPKGEEEDQQKSTGWGLGLLGKKVTDYVPSVATISSSAQGVATSAVSKIMAAGSDPREDLGSTSESVEVSQADKGKTGIDHALSVTSEKLSAVIDEKLCGKGVELEQGGLAPVRIVSQGITYLEGTLGWLGGMAGGVKAAAMDSSNRLISDDLVDKAWEGVKGTAKASKQAVFDSTDAICHVTELGRAALANVADAVLPPGPRSAEELFPNRSLGGVLAIELCGAIVDRDPNADEDEDPFQADDYAETPPIDAAIESIRLLVEQRFQDQVPRSLLIQRRVMDEV